MNELIKRKWKTFCKKTTTNPNNRKRKHRDHRFNLSHFERLIEIRRCQYTGIFLNFHPNDDFCWSLDRYDHLLPYTIENTYVCCKLVNCLKGYFENFLPTEEALTLAKSKFYYRTRI